MNPYARFESSTDEHQRRFFERLRRWHDEMVVHQRVVGRLGPAACSDDCPHAEGRRLWGDAQALLGVAADSLTFLRACAVGGARAASAAGTVSRSPLDGRQPGRRPELPASAGAASPGTRRALR